MKEFFKAHQKLITIPVGILAVIALMLPFLFVQPATATLRVGQSTYALDIASSKTDQQKGLGGRKSLAQNRGMLFVFDTPGTQCFWMKDMHFAIDIIWLDAAKKMTSVVPSVSPNTYPMQYCGDATTKYVIELNAGEAKRAGLTVGQRVSL